MTELEVLCKQYQDSEYKTASLALKVVQKRMEEQAKMANWRLNKEAELKAACQQDVSNQAQIQGVGYKCERTDIPADPMNRPTDIFDEVRQARAAFVEASKRVDELKSYARNLLLTAENEASRAYDVLREVSERAKAKIDLGLQV